MNRTEYVEALKATGHYQAAIVRTISGARFYAQCICGYKSTTRRTQLDAIGALEHHRKLALDAVRVNGRGFPPQRRESV